MRLIAVAAGLIGFVGIAYGADALKFVSEPRHYEAEYMYAPGTSEQAAIPVQFDRKYSFIYVDAKRDPANPKGMQLDADSAITEYLYDDVQSAINQAKSEAAKKNVSIASVLPKYLSALDKNKDTVDCRMVARRMVENLVSNRVEVKKLEKGKIAHRYQLRGDQLDSFIIARNLDHVTISRDPSIKADDKEPRFSCGCTGRGGARVQCNDPSIAASDLSKCGDLRLQYNPLPAASGVFKGKKVLVFNPNDCAKHLDDMDFDSCELMYQVQRCGLRYTQKAEDERVGDPATRGLADYLDVVKNAETLARQDGKYLRFDNAKSAPQGLLDNDGAPSGDSSDNGVPASFFRRFGHSGKAAE